MRIRWTFALGVGALLGLATAASAQVSPEEWHKGTALSLFGGGASATGGTDVAAGAAIGWELTPYLTLEGSGLWMPGGNPDAFSALFGTRVNVVSRRTAVPFVSAGVGVHRAIVEKGQTDTPQFYMQRMNTGADAGTAQLERTFDDFVVAVGGGIDIHVKQHVTLRPDVRVLIVRAETGTRPVTVYGVHLVYHFEEHPITP
jgi:MFS family permease